MDVNLKSIEMEKGMQYECIITSTDDNGVKNAAPIGVICTGSKNVMHRIFKGSKTLGNIIEEKKYTVNVTHDSLLFTLACMHEMPDEYFNSDNSLVNADAYFECEVEKFIEAVKKSDPIKKSEAVVIKSKVNKLVIKNNTKVPNRSFSLLVETLADFSRIDIVDEDMKNEYINRFREANRVINKVGSKEERIAINRIKKELINKGLIID